MLFSVNFKDNNTKSQSEYFLKHKSKVTFKLKVFLAQTEIVELITDKGGEIW